MVVPRLATVLAVLLTTQVSLSQTPAAGPLDLDAILDSPQLLGKVTIRHIVAGNFTRYELTVSGDGMVVLRHGSTGAFSWSGANHCRTTIKQDLVRRLVAMLAAKGFAGVQEPSGAPLPTAKAILHRVELSSGELSVSKSYYSGPDAPLASISHDLVAIDTALQDFRKEIERDPNIDCYVESGWCGTGKSPKFRLRR